MPHKCLQCRTNIIGGVLHLYSKEGEGSQLIHGLLVPNITSYLWLLN